VLTQGCGQARDTRMVWPWASVVRPFRTSERAPTLYERIAGWCDAIQRLADFGLGGAAIEGSAFCSAEGMGRSYPWARAHVYMPLPLRGWEVILASESAD
jgi:hypothetical protein